MNSKEPEAAYKIVAFIFASRHNALEISNELVAAGKYEAYHVVANAVIEVDDRGKAHIHEAGHAGQGAAVGLVGGGLLSLIGGPAGLLLWAVAGAVVGGLAGRIAGRPIATEDLERLAAQMQPDSSAILALVPPDQVETLISGMAGYGGQVVTMQVSDEVSGELHVAAALPGEGHIHAPGDPGEIHFAAALPGEAPPTQPKPAGAEPGTGAE